MAPPASPEVAQLHQSQASIPGRSLNAALTLSTSPLYPPTPMEARAKGLGWFDLPGEARQALCPLPLCHCIPAGAKASSALARALPARSANLRSLPLRCQKHLKTVEHKDSSPGARRWFQKGYRVPRATTASAPPIPSLLSPSSTHLSDQETSLQLHFRRVGRRFSLLNLFFFGHILHCSLWEQQTETLGNSEKPSHSLPGISTRVYISAVLVYELHWVRYVLQETTHVHTSLVSDQHMHISQSSSVGRAQAAKPSPKADQRSCSTSHTATVQPVATRALNRRQQIRPRIDSRSKYPTPTKRKQPCLHKHAVQGVATAPLMSPAHTDLGKGSASQKGHHLQPLSSEEDT